VRHPFKRDTWTFALDGASFVVPADLPEESVARPMRAASTFDALREAVRIYRWYFPTIAAIFLIPIGIGELLVRIAPMHDQFAVGIVIRWVATVTAFGPLVYAISDVCIGNRPRVRRSYRRTGWRALLIVSLDCAVATVLIVLPVAAVYLIGAGLVLAAETIPAVADVYTLIMLSILPAAFIMTVLLLVWVLYVPIIAVLEPRISPLRAIKRSRWLGQGYAKRTAAVAVIIVAIFMLAGSIYTQFAASPFEFVGILAARLLGPIPYIAATLIYYDLSASQEAYGITERPEDLH